MVLLVILYFCTFGLCCKQDINNVQYLEESLKWLYNDKSHQPTNPTIPVDYYLLKKLNESSL